MGCRRGRAEELVLCAGVPPLVFARRAGLTAARGIFFCAALIAAGCSSSPPAAEPDRSRELVIGFPEGNVDASISQFVSMLSLEGLTWGNVDGRSVPRLAESWRWEKGGLELRVKLQPGVFSHDNKPFTAPVVAEILKHAVDDERYPSLKDIKAVRAAGDLELVIELARRSAFLPDDLDMPLSPRRGIGTGPFQVVKRDNREIHFSRFDRYYQGTPAIESIQVKTFDGLRDAWSSLLRAEVDMVTDVPAEAVEFVRTDDVDVIPYKRRYQFVVAFNSRRGPLASPVVRRALNLSVNREALIRRALRGYGTEATGPLWPRHWAYDTSIPPFTFDNALATRLFDEAGLPPGRAGSQSNIPDARFAFTCLINGDYSLHERLGLELQKQLYDVGIDMKFEVVSSEEYNKRIPQGRFDAVLLDMISGPSFARPYIFWRSAKAFQGGVNVFGYENAEAERLFELLRASSLNEAATRSATHRLQRVYLEDPPALFLAWSERARVVGRKFRPDIDPDRDPVLTIWRWTPGDQTLVAAR